MAGAPGLFTSGRDGVAVGQIVKSLVDVMRFHERINMAADHLAENTGVVFFDNKDNPAESGEVGIVERIVYNDFSMQAHGVNLL